MCSCYNFYTKNILKKIKKYKKKVSKKTDELNIEEKINSFKNKIEKLDEKFEISEKTEKAVKVVSEKAGEAYNSVSETIEAKLKDKITFDDFEKVELKLGKIVEAEEVKKSKKLLKLKVDFGENDERQIISGIKEFYTPEEIKGKKAMFVTNLLPRKIMGLESNGMILGLYDEKEFSVLVADKKTINQGTKAG